jgi:signal transduction histidine kinase
VKKQRSSEGQGTKKVSGQADKPSFNDGLIMDVKKEEALYFSYKEFMKRCLNEIPLVAEGFFRVIVNECNNVFDVMREKVENSEFRSQNSETCNPKLIARTKYIDGSVHIEIEDNGPGIPEEMKDKILHPFFTTKKGTQGTGLGLSITNDIKKEYGGTMEVSTTINQGSNFIVKLSKGV